RKTRNPFFYATCCDTTVQATMLPSRMPSKIRLISTVLAGCGAAWLSAPQLASQAPAPGQAGPGGRGGPPQQYWVQKTKGGVYLPPNKPLMKLADLKAKYK